MWERKNSRLRSEGGAYALPLIDVRGMREERIGRSVMLSTTDVVVGLSVAARKYPATGLQTSPLAGSQ